MEGGEKDSISPFAKYHLCFTHVHLQLSHLCTHMYVLMYRFMYFWFIYFYLLTGKRVSSWKLFPVKPQTPSEKGCYTLCLLPHFHSWQDSKCWGSYQLASSCLITLCSASVIKLRNKVEDRTIDYHLGLALAVCDKKPQQTPLPHPQNSSLFLFQA